MIEITHIGGVIQRRASAAGSLREDMRFLTAIVLRREKTLIRILEQITTMVSRNARILDRLRAVDEGVGALKIARVEPGSGRDAC